MKKYFFSSIILLSVAFTLVSWGPAGHRKISASAMQALPPSMLGFQAWAAYLTDHSIVPDIRRETLKDETNWHYIDIDAYPEFAKKKKIVQSYDSLVAIYGKDFVENKGTLPWATKAVFDSLTKNMRLGNWAKAQMFAADLGHLVADGHMPLHITDNYDGQLTGNSGIHGRYEGDMISIFSSQINYTAVEAKEVSNVQAYIFNYLYRNYAYVDSLIEADNYVQKLATDNMVQDYYSALWGKTKGFTVKLFSDASHVYASLLYTAWKLAGSPEIKPEYAQAALNANCVTIDSICPEAQGKNMNLHFTVKKRCNFKLELRDKQGKKLNVIYDDTLWASDNTVTLKGSYIPAGQNFIVLTTEQGIQVMPFVYGLGY